MSAIKSPPGLIGTIFTEEEKESARERNKLLLISLMTDSVCNLSCPDCYVGEMGLSGDELSIEERKYVLDQAKDLGARTLRIAGEGEPLLDKKFWELTDYAINSLEMNVFFFTNGTIITENIADRIFDNEKLTAVLKFSGDSELMECLTGGRGFFAEDKFVERDGLLIPVYLKRMIAAGMNQINEEGNSRLGIEFLLREANKHCCTQIFRWTRRNNIIPYIEQNLEAGKATTWSDYGLQRVPDAEAFALSRELSEIDRQEFGFEWRPGLPYMSGGISEAEISGCKKFTYNVVISSRGDGQLCYAVKFPIGNVRNSSLKEILEHQTRQKFLDNPCYNCVCRVYSRSGQPDSVEGLNLGLDYETDCDRK
ncbi:radical SAM/SPASM domain-containing protein [Nanoarchaeota archaeon]